MTGPYGKNVGVRLGIADGQPTTDTGRTAEGIKGRKGACCRRLWTTHSAASVSPAPPCNTSHNSL